MNLKDRAQYKSLLDILDFKLRMRLLTPSQYNEEKQRLEDFFQPRASLKIKNKYKAYTKPTQRREAKKRGYKPA